MLYGYSSKTLNDDGLLELSEVTFAVEPGKLRKLAEFLVYSAEYIEKNEGRADPQWHAHIDEFDKDWRTIAPSVDVVVVFPESWFED